MDTHCLAEDVIFILKRGDWDIQFQDILNNTTCIIRYVLNKDCLLKDFKREGMRIIEINQIR